MTEDGYPTEEELSSIRAWPWRDVPGLMAFIRSIWWAAEWGWDERAENGHTVYSISTGGWSGNEDIISALQDNAAVWRLTWVSSRRGGHYEFEPLKMAPDEPAAMERR